MRVPESLTAGELQLRRLAADDVPALHRYLSDPRVYESTSSNQWTVGDVESLVAASATDNSGSFICLGIVREERLIGMVRLGSFDARNRRAELGYDLEPESWGRGYIHRAVSALLDHAFGDGLYRVEATVMEGNVRSEHVLERLGFRREGVLRGYKQVRGEPKDFTMFGLLAPDWEARVVPRVGLEPTTF